MQVLHYVTATRFEICQQRHTIANVLEVVDGQSDVHRSSHGNQVQHGIRGPAEGSDEHHRVLERLARHDAARFQIEFQKISDRRTSAQAFVKLQWVFSRRGGAIRQGHAQRLNRGRHGVCRVHASAGSGARARIVNDFLAPLFVDVPGEIFAVALKCRYDIELLAAM